MDALDFQNEFAEIPDDQLHYEVAIGEEFGDITTRVKEIKWDHNEQRILIIPDDEG